MVETSVSRLVTSDLRLEMILPSVVVPKISNRLCIASTANPAEARAESSDWRPAMPAWATVIEAVLAAVYASTAPMLTSYTSFKLFIKSSLSSSVIPVSS